MLLGGRDRRKGGSWMGINRNGRFAAVTNFEAPASPDEALTSRGQLVTDWLSATTRVDQALQALPQCTAAYNPFSLLLADSTALGYVSNQEIEQRRCLAPGIYGLSNHALDSSWPKINSGKRLLRQWLSDADRALRLTTAAAPVDWLLEMMRSEAPASAAGTADRRQARFVRHPIYGTRSTTVLLLADDGNALFHERSFAADGAVTADNRYTFTTTTT